MAIYGNTISFGGGGQNDTLPPLLDNFKANKKKYTEIKMKDISVGSVVVFGKYKGSPIEWKVVTPTEVFGGSIMPNSKILKIFNRDLISKRPYDSYINKSSKAGEDNTYDLSGLSAWLNSDSINQEYYNEKGFLSEWTEEEKGLINTQEGSGLHSSIYIPIQPPEGAYKGYDSNSPVENQPLYWLSGMFFNNNYDCYSYAQISNNQKDNIDKNTPLGVEPVFRINQETVFLFDGERHFLESALEQEKIVISADKMPVSRAADLAGAVWVYGDHLPKNVNDGTKTELSRDEIVADSGTIEKSVSWDKSKNFYARQFTYNPKKQYQTMTEGGLTSLNPNEFTNPRKVYEYGSVAPEDKNLIWIQPDGLAKFWNGSEWVAIAGVYAEEEG